MNKREFELELSRLRDAHERRADNERCVECVGCERCVDSTFCRNGHQLVRCHYCVDVERSRDSTHCRSSKDLAQCSHCVGCERCSGSSYLVRSLDCTGCTYCFGCIGLVRKDFHILNVPYERGAYFALTSRLARELGLS